MLIGVGAYKKGMDLELDRALSKKEQIREFLTQDMNSSYSYDEIIDKFLGVTND